MAFVDVIRADEMERLRVCDADDCESLYVDMSKNALAPVLQHALRQSHGGARVPRAHRVSRSHGATTSE